METKKKIFWSLALIACLPFTLPRVDAATSSAGSIAGTIQNKSGSPLVLYVTSADTDCNHVFFNDVPSLCYTHIILDHFETIKYSIDVDDLKGNVGIILYHDPRYNGNSNPVCDWIIMRNSGAIYLYERDDPSHCINNNGHLSIK